MNHMPKNKENRALLEKVLKLAGLKRSVCSRLLDRHKSSLDGYIYRFAGAEFPGSFSFYFLNAIYSSLLQKDHSTLKEKGKLKEYLKEIKVKKNTKFDEILKDCADLKIREKLLTPALMFHISNLVRLSTSKYANLTNDNFVDQYIDLLELKSQEYNEHIDDHEYINVEGQKEEDAIDTLPSKEYDQNRSLEYSLKEFFPIIEKLRKEEVPKYYSHREYIIYPPKEKMKEKILLPKNLMNYLSQMYLEHSKIEKIVNDAKKLQEAIKQIEKFAQKGYAQSSSQWPELERLFEAENQSTNPSRKKIA